ncbi:Protein translocase subunit [Frankliniella fusca]|uniref:Protein translocase subunit n=1 Tax=Frankliniella fusca TaxID=407009 RepID=A0AAE1GW62_9NEOP|nr:Protein translocase subunit [Frankliniella fusca]
MKPVGCALRMRSPTCRPRSLMESLLVAKMERATQLGTGAAPSAGPAPAAPAAPAPTAPPLLLRTDSTDSASSFSSASSDVCRCDDCLLGTVDVWANRKKVEYVIPVNESGERRSPWGAPCRPCPVRGHGLHRGGEEVVTGGIGYSARTKPEPK